MPQETVSKMKSQVRTKQAVPLEIQLAQAKTSGQPIRAIDAPIMYPGDEIPFGTDPRQDRWEELRLLKEQEATQAEIDAAATQAAANTGENTETGAETGK